MKDNQQTIKPGMLVKFKAGFDDREYQVISVLNDTDGEKLHLALFPLNKFTRIDDVELVSDTNNSGSEKEKPNMKPFDLKKALAGAQVVTRNGQTVSELHHFKTIDGEYKLGVVLAGDLINCTESGKYLIGRDNDYDLFMGQVKRSGWVNIYPNHIIQVDKCDMQPVAHPGSSIWSTFDDARANMNGGCIATVKVEWEE